MMTAYNEKVGGLITKLQEKAEKTNTDVYTQYQIVLEETVREGEGHGEGQAQAQAQGHSQDSTSQPLNPYACPPSQLPIQHWTHPILAGLPWNPYPRRDRGLRYRHYVQVPAHRAAG